MMRSGPPRPLLLMAGGLFSVYAWLAWTAVLGVFVPLILGALRFKPERAWATTRAMSRAMLAVLGVRLTVRGGEALDPQAHYLYMCNHQSRLDPYLLDVALPHKAVGIEHDTNFRYPLYGLLISRWGNIPVSHEDHAQAMAAMHLAARLHRAGRSLVIFPEGVLTRTGRLGPFKSGGFHLAVEAEAQVVPVTIAGAFERAPGTSWLVRPGDVSVTLGAPMPAAGQPIEVLEAAVRTAMLDALGEAPNGA